MTKAAENGQLTFYVNEEDASVAVVENQSDKIWYSNSLDIDGDEKATAYYKRILRSQLQVQYYNENVQSALMDSYNDSVLNEQFEIEYLPDGMTVIYTMGKLAESLLLPETMSEERFLLYTEKMDASAKKKFTRNYILVDVEGGSPPPRRSIRRPIRAMGSPISM